MANRLRDFQQQQQQQLQPDTNTAATTTTEPLPECILPEEQSLGKDPEYLDAGVPLCPDEELPGYENYDPSDIPSNQAEPDNGIPIFQRKVMNIQFQKVLLLFPLK